MSKPIIAVMGATGAQGSAVVDALLKLGKYNVRGLTRDLAKKESKDLAAKGVEMVKADPTVFEDLTKAFKGAQKIFAFTIPDRESPDHDLEFKHGKVIVDAAKESQVKFAVWSDLPNVEKISNGKWNVPHFTNKSKVGDLFRQAGIASTNIQPGFFMQNFVTYFAPSKDSEGNVVFSLPVSPSTFLSAVDITNIGEACATVFQNEKEWEGKTIELFGTHQTAEEFVKQYGELTGQKTKFVALPQDAIGHEMGQMFGWFGDYTYYGHTPDNSLAKKVAKITTWGDYVKSGAIKIRSK